MFVTNDVFRSKAFSMLAAPGEIYWTAAEIPLQQIWFLLQALVTDTHGGDTATFGRTFILSDFKQVEYLLKTCNPNEFKLQSLNIITPSYINKTDDWKMEQLGCIWDGKDPKEKWRKLFVFETITGNRYCDSPLRTEISKIKIGEIIIKFSFPK